METNRRIAVLILAERGLIDLDAPINSYLGEAKLVARVGSAEDATVRRVLRHRAGLPLHFNYLYVDEVELPPDMNQAIRRHGILIFLRASWILLGNAAAGRSAILSSKSLAIMTSDELGRRSQEGFFGLGFAVWRHRGGEVWHQSGSMPGVSAQLLISPDRDIVVAVLINQALAPDWSIANDVLGVFAPELDRRSQAIEDLPRLAGKWEGYVSISERLVVPIAVTFDREKGPLAINLDGRVLPVVQTRNVEDGFFELTSLGALVPGDIPRAGDDLRFKLKFRGDSINGSVAVRELPKADRVSSGVSYWVELERSALRRKRE